MALCEKATNLVLELKRNNSIPVYNSTLIQEIIRDIENCVETFNNIRSSQDSYNITSNNGPPQFSTQATIGLDSHLFMIQRNKRCVLAYLHTRFARLREFWWETGRTIPQELRDCLSITEASALDRYDEIISKYNVQMGVDLRSEQAPPKDLYIEVQAVVDIGEINTESGPIKLRKGARQYMRRSDCELLIRNGSLEQVS